MTQPSPQNPLHGNNSHPLEDVEWGKKFGYFLADEFELQVHERLVRARREAMESSDVPVAKDSSGS